MRNGIKMECGCVVVAGEDGVVVYVLHCSGRNEVKKDCRIRWSEHTHQELIKKREYCPEMSPLLPGKNNPYDHR